MVKPALLETMRAEDGVVRLLDRHFTRLRASAEYFAIALDCGEIQRAVAEAAHQIDRLACLRLMVEPNGAWSLETRTYPSETPRRVLFSNLGVRSNDPILQHKTTNRQLYERAREGLTADTDVILINERGEATETTIANIAVIRDGTWITPPLSCGLLGGVMRAELIAEGAAAEGVIDARSFIAGETVRCFNALRGVFEAQFEIRNP